MRKALGWPLAVALAVYVILAYRSVYPLVFVPRVSLQPWLMNNGFVVYRDIVDQHEAAIQFALTLTLPLIGDPLLQLKWGFIALSVLTLLLIYAFAGRRLGYGAAAVAAAIYVVWLPLIGGGMLWYETFLAPMYFGLYALWPSSGLPSRRRLLMAGLLLGIAAATKQHAWLVGAIFGAVYLISALRGRKSIGAALADLTFLALGAVLTYGAYLALILSSGAGADYLYWAWYNNIFYGSEAAADPQPIHTNALLGLGLPVAALAVFAIGRAWRGKPSSADWLLCLVALAAAATAYPRFELFHLLPALPAVAMACAHLAAAAWRAVANLSALRQTRRAAGLAAAAIALAAGLAWPTWLALEPSYKVWQQPGPQTLRLYAELIPVAQRIRSLTSAQEGIYVFPDVEYTSNLYLLSGHLPPKPWVYTYPWYTRPAIVSRLLASLEESPVALVAYFPDQKVDGLPVSEYAAPLDEYFRERYATIETLNTPYGPVQLMRRK